MKAPQWDLEKLAELEASKLEVLFANAKRLGNGDLLLLCEAALAKRDPTRKSSTVNASSGGQGDFVAEYHFVCSGNRGVIDNRDGTFWTGSWVVARDNVELSLKFGAYVALHENKNEASYLQGVLLEYRFRERDMVDKENVGIEFHCRTTPHSLAWEGGGSGEKGYAWRSISSAKSDLAR